jgi:RNA polymerase sigma-70 factor (ECF subfamily)
VYLLCYRFVGSHEDASDLSQDVFLRAFRGLRSFRGQSTLATWLYRIGVNVCLNRVGAKDTLRKLTEPIETQQFVDVRAELPSDLMLKNERTARVRAAIAQLPRKQRATLILRTYHEMSHQEIADVLGSSVGAVKANFFHALGNLKKLLAETA